MEQGEMGVAYIMSYSDISTVDSEESERETYRDHSPARGGFLDYFPS